MSPRRTASRAPAAGAQAGSGRRLKGRHWVAAWFLGFLVVALIVVWRQSAALAASRDLTRLQKTRGALEVQRSATVGEVHRAQSRGVMVPLAQQKLGLRLPQDSEITILQDPRPR